MKKFLGTAAVSAILITGMAPAAMATEPTVKIVSTETRPIYCPGRVVINEYMLINIGKKTYRVVTTLKGVHLEVRGDNNLAWDQDCKLFVKKFGKNRGTPMPGIPPK